MTPVRLGLSSVVIVAFVLVAGACAKAVAPALVPTETAAWRSTTSARLDYPVPGHEDRYREIRMNERGFSAVPADSGRLTFPEGTVIVKDIYASSAPASGEGPVMVTAMVKASSDPDARGGWLWVVKDLASGNESRILGDFCVRCHANANERHPYGQGNPRGVFSDYVFYVPKR